MKKNNKTCTVFLCVIAALLLMIIFSFSAQNGSQSSGLSLKVTRVICRIIFFGYGDMSDQMQQFVVAELHGFVRKLAHFSEYALLGAVFYSIFIVSDVSVPKIGKWGTALLCAFAAACADEIHQYFVPARAMSFRDVLIDSAGALVGIICLRLLLLLVEYIRSYFSHRGHGERML